MVHRHQVVNHIVVLTSVLVRIHVDSLLQSIDGLLLDEPLLSIGLHLLILDLKVLIGAHICQALQAALSQVCRK